MTKPFTNLQSIGLLLVVTAVLFFWRLGAPGLMDPDEGRYAEIAREMLASGDWLTPHLNGFKYFEKPPLAYWLTALSLWALGPSEVAVRLVPALSAMGGVLGLWFLGRGLSSSWIAFLGAATLAVCPGYVLMGRLLTLDMLLTACLTWGLSLAYLAVIRNQRTFLPWAYLALALGVLTKGPVAIVLPGLIFVLWAFLRRTPRLLMHLWHPGGALLFAVIVLPWFLLISWRHPEFPAYFFLQEHLARFLTARVHAGQPVYYFLGILAVGLLPWTFLLPWALRRSWDRWTVLREPGDQLFLWVWAGVVLVFFSLSRAKLPPYILPALPPLALLLAQAWDQAPGQPVRAPLFYGGLMAWSALSLVGWLLLKWPPGFLATQVQHLAYLQDIIFPVLAVLTLLPAYLWVLPRRSPFVAAIPLLMGVMAINLLLVLGMEKVAAVRSPRALAQALQPHWRPGDALVGYQVYSQGLSYYLGQPLHIFGLTSELDFGRAHSAGAGLYLADFSELQALIQSRPRTFLLIKSEALEPLSRQLGRELPVLGRWKDKVLAVIQ